MAGAPGCRERPADRPGTMRRALWRGGTVPARLGGVGTTQPWAKPPGRARHVAAVRAHVAGATARAAQRYGAGASAAPGARGDLGPHAARVRRDPRRADHRGAAAAGAGRPAVE